MTQIHLYAHLSADAITHLDNPDAPDEALCGRIEQAGNRLLSVDQIRAWCGRPDVQVVITQVIDLRERLECQGYRPTPRIREHVIVRDGTCVFPWCGRNARHCDLDHVIPYNHDHPEQGGPTATDNLAPLCRRHHRLKTRGRWRYEMTEPGVFVWTSPLGNTYLRDHTGSQPIGRAWPEPGVDDRADRRTRPTSDHHAPDPATEHRRGHRHVRARDTPWHTDRVRRIRGPGQPANLPTGHPPRCEFGGPATARLRGSTHGDHRAARTRRLAGVPGDPPARAHGRTHRLRHDPGRHRTQHDDAWKARLDQGDPILAVRDGDRLVAMGAGWHPPEDPDRMMVWGMWTAPEARGHGHARALLGWLVEHARTRGVTTVELHVTDGNDTARRLYEARASSPPVSGRRCARAPTSGSSCSAGSPERQPTRVSGRAAQKPSLRSWRGSRCQSLAILTCRSR